MVGRRRHFTGVLLLPPSSFRVRNKINALDRGCLRTLLGRFCRSGASFRRININSFATSVYMSSGVVRVRAENFGELERGLSFCLRRLCSMAMICPLPGGGCLV